MPETPVFRKLRGARASDEIAAQIRSQLAAGKLPVGTRFPSERALAEQFGVSRNTLREALRSLEHAGLIRLKKGASGGAIVQDRSSDAIVSGLLDMYHLGGIRPSDLTQARIMYESIIIRLACANATPADIAALNANIEAADEARKSGDFGARIDLHIEFHRMLARIAGNPIMVAVMNGVLDIMTRFLRSIGPYDNTFVTPSRRRFMKHFAAANTDAAVAEMETLLKRLEKNYLSRVTVLEPPGRDGSPQEKVASTESMAATR
jgi:GntR family transcriptional regulator, transcriptional repressor for pyruvate dehydrogenase complex